MLFRSKDGWQPTKDKDGNIDGVDPKTWQQCVPKLKEQFRLKVCRNGVQPTSWYVCHACHGHMKKKKMPPMCAQNGLKVEPIPEQFKDVTQLEQDCCATNKLFMKIHVKGKMRWKNQKEKVINVPVREEDMLRTVEALPKIPEETGLIQLNWKYKEDITTPYKSELVRPKLILDILTYLKKNKNPYYQFYDDYEAYKKRLDAVKISYQNDVQQINDLDGNGMARKIGRAHV